MNRVGRDEYHSALITSLDAAAYFRVGTANSGRDKQSFTKSGVLQLIHVMAKKCTSAGENAVMQCFCIKVGADEHKGQEVQFFLGQHARGECPFADYGKNT